MKSKKYPRTPHLSWSPGVSKDDRVSKDISQLISNPIIITEKFDGSNACISKEGVFARTHAHAPTHPSFDWLKAFHRQIAEEIPEDIQIFGENLYAQHSIAYSQLPGYFLVFGIRYLINDTWANWEEVDFWASVLSVPTTTLLWQGTVGSEKELQELTYQLASQPSAGGGIREGVVVRVANAFPDQNFDKCVAKLVRANHVQTSVHWAHQKLTKNKLREAGT